MLPQYFPLVQNVVDSITGLPILKAATNNSAGFGGAVFKHYLLPNNAGGTVVVSAYNSGNESKIYNSSSAVIPRQALIYNASGGVVSADFGNAVRNVHQPFNFAGIALSTALTPAENWILYAPTNAPIPRSAGSLVYDQLTLRSTLFGGFNTGTLNDTWEWDGNNWIQRTPATSPTARYSHSMAYDSYRGKMVMFGGINASNTFLADTWEWDGTTWAHITPSLSPKSLSYASMVYDSYRGKTVLFGGDHNGTAQNDTNEYDGTTWAPITTSISPPIRFGQVMGFDIIRNRAVMFGGLNGSSQYNDTYEYDGYNWTQINTSTFPTARTFATMTFNTTKKVMVLFGGIDFINNVVLNDTWEYDGINWSLVSAVGPSPRAQHQMTYDPTQNKVVLVGGVDQTITNIKGDTWQLGYGMAPVIVQTSGDGYVYYDATGIYPIAVGNLVRKLGTTVSVQTTLPHSFVAGNTFTLTPGETNFPTGSKTVASVVDQYNFTYTESGSNISSTSPETIRTPTARVIPSINDFLGPSSVAGTITSVFDGYSPVFGFAVESPVIDPTTSNLLQLQINNSNVGIIKMRVEPFIGFISPLTATIVNFEPTFASVGDTILMNGAGFIGTTEVLFNGGSVSASYSVVSNNQLLIIVPSNAQTGTISVLTGIGSNTSSQTLHMVPVITSVVGSSYSVGSSITISGHTFTPTTAISFNGTAQPTYTIVNDTTITTTIPVGASSGYVSLTTPDGTATFTGFGIVAPPVISGSGVAPITGAGGTLMALTGSGFTSAGSALDGYGTVSFVKVGGGQTLAASRTIFNDTQMSIVVPSLPGAQASTSFNIQIINNGGTTTSAQAFSIIPLPTFISSSAFSPTSGAGGVAVDIFGQYGFANATSISFDGYASSVVGFSAISAIGQVSRTSSTVSVITIAAHGFSTGNTIFIQTSTDTNFPSAYVSITSTGANTFTYSQAGAATTSSATITFISDSHLRANVPFTPSISNPNVGISINGIGGIRSTTDSNAAGSGPTTPSTFTILLQPTITSISLTTGSTGTTVSIMGTNMLTVDRVFFTSFSATANSGQVSRTSTTVSVSTVAAHGFTTGDTVLVDSTDSNFPTAYVVITSTGANTFTYSQAGSATTSSTAISFFDAVANSTFTTINNNQINATVPSGSTGIINGPITVSAGSLFAVSGSSFTYLPTPTIASTNKTSGGYGSPPTQVIITGTHLVNSNNTAPVVRFGGVVASVPTFSSGSITAIVPNGGGNGITLTTDGGSASTTFTVIQPPVIYGSTPTSNCSTNNDPIFINGNNFIQTGATSQIYFYFQTFNSITPTTITNNVIIVNSGSVETYFNQFNFNAITYIIYFVLTYDSGNGSYQVSSPQTFTDNRCIS